MRTASIADGNEGNPELSPEDEPLDPELLDEPEPEPDEPEPDEAGDPDAEPDEPEPQQTQQRRRQRPGEVVRLRERLDRTERELAELQNRPAQPPAFDPQAAAREQARLAEERRARRELMTPAEVAADVALELRQEFNAGLMQARLEGFDQADRQRFDVLKQTNRAAARLAPEVERMLSQRRALGDYTLDRTTIFDALYGREIRERGLAAANGQRRDGARRVAAVTTRPAAGRGDVARGGAGRRNQDSDDEALLRQVTAGDI